MSKYEQTLQFLYSQLPMYQRVGKVALKKGLEQTLVLLEFLDHPHNNYPAVHIAGTNGKGSVSHMLAACYQAAGLKVGLYTSPHYRDFRERIRINGTMVAKQAVVDFMQRMQPVMLEQQPSFFELTVTMAFDAFRRAQVDLAIVETGLGGRLDSTNVLTPELSIITNIGFDHMHVLGDTLPQIAAEKAGIIKQHIPVVVGRSQQPVMDVFEQKAAEMQTSVIYADQILQHRIIERTWRATRLEVVDNSKGEPRNFEIDNAGPFVAQNAITAIAALEYGPYALEDSAIAKGLASLTHYTDYTGRWQILGEAPWIVADSAHNKEGLVPTIERFTKGSRGALHFVLGLVQEKDICEFITLFPTGASFYFCQPQIPRGRDAHELMEQANALGFRGKAYSSVSKALVAAKMRANAEDSIYVGGSSFVVAEVV